MIILLVFSELPKFFPAFVLHHSHSRLKMRRLFFFPAIILASTVESAFRQRTPIENIKYIPPTKPVSIVPGYACGTKTEIRRIETIPVDADPKDYACYLVTDHQSYQRFIQAQPSTVQSRFNEWPTSAHFDSLIRDFGLNRDFFM